MQIPCTKQELLLLEKIAFAARKMQVPCYVIGGFVRDKIIDRKTKDIDIVCVGDGIELAEQVASLFRSKPPVSVFKNFGTAQIKLDDIDIEFVGARKESYRSESRNPLVENGTLEDDQLRRDLTINALAVSLNKEDYGCLVDPFNGLADIEKKILRTPLSPAQTFIDDPLRMLRTIRFATQLRYHIEEKTFEAIKEHAARIEIISKERIADELNKIMMCNKPSVGFDLLFKTKLLHLIFPHLTDLAGAQYIDGKGHKDNFYHTLQVLDNICPHTKNLWLRWAALLHDIGKPATKLFEKGHGWTFHNHEWIGAQMIPGIFKYLKLPQNESMKYVQKIVQLHHRPVSLTKENITDSAIRRLLFDAGNDLEDLLTLCNADITSKNQEKVIKYKENYELVKERLKAVEENDKIRNWQPPISGELIMQTFGLTPSKEVGEIKDAVREAILDGLIKNNYEEAFSFMLQYANEQNIKPM
ncbi:MAG: HD domain-containing protein [Bacteroidetes bacterium]|jgi:poly(A) polymerase|nr:HD domain-containing protein [Bacteroidota bacterium]HMT35588.1 HD domain-containing protein [Chitinophagaceae bacterium]MBK7587252.1 HD domain-containing protein [Bacteroidota bacterium]MBK8328224.1 HD domain-containing protein [Bacteroidota bacterium]MBK9300180.1 HD domain-containing protein [Bacteroidota bacterium]